MNLIYTCIYICSVLHPETSGPECPIEMILIWSATEAVALPSPCQSSHAKSHIPYLFKHPAYWPLSPPPCHPGDNAPVHFPFSRLSCLQADTGSSSRDMQLQHSRPQYCPGTVPQGRGTLQVVSWVGVETGRARLWLLQEFIPTEGVGTTALSFQSSLITHLVDSTSLNRKHQEKKMMRAAMERVITDTVGRPVAANSWMKELLPIQNIQGAAGATPRNTEENSRRQSSNPSWSDFWKPGHSVRSIRFAQ